jgi:N-ethylmaleimide reductase
MMKKSDRLNGNSLKLLSPGRLGRYLLPTRVVMAPMTRNRVGRDGVPNDLTLIYYAQRASAALIITEATQISQRGVGYANTPGIHSSEQIVGWQRVTDEVHRQGTHIFLQLFHAGRISHPTLQPGGALPVAPSSLVPEGYAMTYDGPQPFVVPRQLQQGEIPEIVGQFRTAARNASAAGFDGVEIHAANGYLLDQFLRDGSNQRADEYGGSVESRGRLLNEVTEAVVSVWGNDRVGVRLSPLSSFNSMRDSNPALTFRAAVERLNKFSLAYLHIVEQDDSPASGAHFDLRELRTVWKNASIVNGGYDRERAEKALASEGADFVSFGRPFISNPDLPLRLEKGAPLTQSDRTTFYGGDERGYIDYPFLQDFVQEDKE